MLKVEMHVHPLTYRVLKIEYGTSDCITLKNTDILFDTLVGSKAKKNIIEKKMTYTSLISFCVEDRQARHIQEHAVQIATRLFRHHKMQLCWYATAQVRALGKGHARAAICDWLNLYKVDDTEYSVDTAYKLFQRFCWDFDKKNQTFGKQLRGKMGVKLSTKKAARAKLILPLQPLTLTMRDIEVELAIARFVNQYSQTFNRMPYRLPKHAQVYAYHTMKNMSIRETATKLQMKPSTVYKSIKSLRVRMDRNLAIRSMVEQSFALPAKK